MTAENLPLSTFYRGWETYQEHLVAAVAPLSTQELHLRAAPELWSAGMIATHLVGTRAGWFHLWMGEGGQEGAELARWDEEDPVQSAAQLVQGLEASWRLIEDCLARWTEADLEASFQRPPTNSPIDGPAALRSRQWIIWHVLEHDMHHGGELSFLLGMHGVPAIDL